MTADAPTLITFLGRVPKTENGYRRTRYEFGNGDKTDPLAFFGWALIERLAASRVVILGTRGSMWDHLFEGDLDLGDHAAHDRLALIEAVGNQAVDQALLDALAPVLAGRLGVEVVLRLIPYARTEDEQIEVLRIMAEVVADGQRVHLDVTHGFRHLPMLALMSALHLRISRGAHIDGIWYGAFDPDTNSAPVYDLVGLMKLAEGLQALASFDKDGDYGVFVPLLRGRVPDEAVAAMERASYYENILNVAAATGKLREARRALERAKATLAPDLALLWPTIDERLRWVEEERQFEKQLALARQCLARQDYLRATLYAYEAVITRLCQQQRVNANDFESREQARKGYEERISVDDRAQWERYSLLKNLRNQVAHGTRGCLGEVQQCLLNEARMRDQLSRLIDEIATGRLPAASAG